MIVEIRARALTTDKWTFNSVTSNPAVPIYEV